MKVPMCVTYAAYFAIVSCLLGSAAGQAGPGITFGPEEPEPQPVRMYFYSGEEGGLAVEAPDGNTTAEVECPGHPTPKIAGYYIGTWASRPVNTPVEIDNQISCGLWTYSNEMATNVRFNVEIFVNGQELFQFETESANLGTEPLEIKGSGQHDEPILLETGDILSVRLAYFSDSRIILGPGADSVLVVGDVQHDSGITVKASPIKLEIMEPGFEGQFVAISAYINDSFASKRYIADIRIQGRTDAESVSEPVFGREGNATVVTWLWDFAADGAGKGEYRISVMVSYGHEDEFTAVGTYDIGIEDDGDSDEFIGNLGWTGWTLIASMVGVCSGISYILISRRRAANKSR